MATITITGLRTKTRIGIHAWEQQIDQTICVDAVIDIDLAKPINSIEQSVDYASVSTAITEFIESNSFELIETLIQQMALLLVEQFGLDKFSLTVSKPNAVANADNISISLDYPS